MGLPSADFETDREQIAAIITTRAPELSPAPTAFAGELAGSLAQFSQALGGDNERAGRDAVPSADSSTQGLTTWGTSLGLANGAGGYGPRGATYAQGFAAYLTGQAGTAYAAGQQATYAGITLRLRVAVTIPGMAGTGQVLGTWDADPASPGSVGTAGNLPAGTVLNLVSPPPTSDSTITLQTGASVLGQGAEQDASILLRIQRKMQRPPNGGNGSDLIQWIEEATDAAGNPASSALLLAYIFPNYFGTGSPLIVVLQAGSGTGRQVPAGVLSTLAAYVNGTASREGQRPVGTDVTVLTGFMPLSRALVCRIRTIPSKSAFAYDWVRGATPYAVNSVTTTGLPAWATNVGANVLLELDKLAPISLKDAVSAAATPRVQVDTRNPATGDILGPVVPEQWPVQAYQDAAGRTTLALKVPSVGNFAAWVRTTNEVYSGGPIVVPVAASVLATIDASGPSRASGLADRAQQWQDTVGVTTLSTAAENTLDGDGVTRVVARCLAGGVLIGFPGVVPPSVQDVTATDNTISGPEVLRAGRILITD